MNHRGHLLACVAEGHEIWFGDVLVVVVCVVAAATLRGGRASVAHSVGQTRRQVLSAPLFLLRYLTQGAELGWQSARPTCRHVKGMPHDRGQCSAC